MEQYKKPVTNIVELEKVDVLTSSGICPYCSKTMSGLDYHIATEHADQANQSSQG